MPESHSKSEDTQVGVCIYQHQLQNLKTQQMVYVNAERHSKSENTQLVACKHRHHTPNRKTYSFVYVNTGTRFKK